MSASTSLSQVKCLARSRVPVLSYCDWVEHVRGLGIKTSTEYALWATTRERGREVPSRPDIAYKATGEWRSWRTALGGAREPNAGRIMNERACCWVLDVAAKAAPDLEFQRAVAQSAPNLFVRRRGSGDRGWAALHLKSTGAPHHEKYSGARKSVYRYACVLRSSEVGKVLVCPSEQKLRVCTTEELVATDRSSSMYITQVRVDFDDDSRYRVDSVYFDSFARLERLLATGVLPKRSIAAWGDFQENIAHHCGSRQVGNVNTHRRLSAAAGSLLYEPLGLQASGLETLGRVHNVSLSGLRCLQRVARCPATSVPGERRCHGKLSRRPKSSVYTGPQDEVALDANDEVDFVTFLLPPRDDTIDRLEGAFIFPKMFLLEQGYIGDKEKGIEGQKTITMYPPGAPRAADKGAFAHAQQPFFIDLAGKQEADASDIEKLHRIFSTQSR
ncbi:unnamed protein product [Amoebophrya sp. A25]|nr:unnamed protein product [Amoebophrya sp. A25]|eukprot:GSA25T00026955001.1